MQVVGGKIHQPQQPGFILSYMAAPLDLHLTSTAKSGTKLTALVENSLRFSSVISRWWRVAVFMNNLQQWIIYLELDVQHIAIDLFCVNCTLKCWVFPVVLRKIVKSWSKLTRAQRRLGKPRDAYDLSSNRPNNNSKYHCQWDTSKLNITHAFPVGNFPSPIL